MTEMLGKLRDWLGTLSARERNLVYGAGALLGIAALYVILILPFQASTSRAASRVQKKTADLAWMRQNATQAISAAGIATSRGSGESLMVLVDRTAREAGLSSSLRDQSPNGESNLRLRLEAASFDALMTWLASLQQQYGVSIDSAQIDQSGTGLVNASLSLSQGGARS